MRDFAAKMGMDMEIRQGPDRIRISSPFWAGLVQIKNGLNSFFLLPKLRRLAKSEEVDLRAMDEVHFQQHGSRCRMWIPPELPAFCGQLP